jgi:hypothetical protein
MTLVHPGYFQEIIGTLRDQGFEVHHFALLADPATVIGRLHRRSLGLEPWRAPWEVDHLAEWLHTLAQPQFARQIHTDHQTVFQVADSIARSAGLTITPSTDGPLRARLHRYATTVRHIRWH